MMPLPKRTDLCEPLVKALRELGGSAAIRELDQQVIHDLHLTDEQISVPYKKKPRYTEMEYRLAWAKSDLKAFESLDSNNRGIWFLTAAGMHLSKIDPKAVMRAKRSRSRIRDLRQRVEDTYDRSGLLTVTSSLEEEELDNGNNEVEAEWRDELLACVTAMPPNAFERLCQRLLREAGFVEVRVLGKAGDQGIDGVGVVQLGGLLSFPAYFQCKRYQGTVGAAAVRDFRGAMAGRGNHGLLITTGSFTPDARREATRDGVPPIDLIDGERLIGKLKELGLGIEVRIVEEVNVLHEFFETL